MKYLDPKFSVQLGGDAYAEGWERIFGKGAKLRELTRISEEAGGYFDDPSSIPPADLCSVRDDRVHDLAVDVEGILRCIACGEEPAPPSAEPPPRVRCGRCDGSGIVGGRGDYEILSCPECRPGEP